MIVTQKTAVCIFGQTQRRTEVVATVSRQRNQKMKPIVRSRIIFALMVAIVLTFLTWLVLGDSSPLKDFFLFHVAIANLVLKLLVVPYSVVMVLRPLIWADA